MGINETQVTQGKSDLAVLMLKVGPRRTHVSASRQQISSRQGSKSKKRKTVIRSKVGPSICNDDESDVDSEDDATQEQSATRVAIDKELVDYMTLKLTPDEKKHIENNTLNNGLLSWWRGHAAAFAILARVVHCVLAHPAASAKSECNFSDAGNTLTHKRNQLSPNIVDTLLFMRSNIAK